jgi:hypothetical protein
MNDHGLDLTRPDITNAEELAEFRAFYTATIGYALPAFEPWMELRPDVLKRYRLQVQSTASAANEAFPLIRTLSSLLYYVIAAYEDGILYEIRVAQTLGATRSDVLETIALAFLDGGPRGMRYVATGAMEYLRTFEDPPSPSTDRWPPGWSCDPSLLAAGLDFSSPDLLPGELDLVRAWYRRVTGEVPGHVELLGRYRPSLLKAHRNRFEHAIRDSLPAQAVPFLLICLAVARGSAEGARGAIAMGNGLGLTRDQIIDAVAWGMMFGGTSGVDAAYAATAHQPAIWPADDGVTEDAR